MDERIVVALERIASALEKRNEPYKPSPEEVEENRLVMEKFEKDSAEREKRKSEALLKVVTAAMEYFGFAVLPEEGGKNGV